MRCAIYLRISLDATGKEAGVERQRAACEDLAQRLGWTVTEVFSDNDISAFSGKVRPGFEAMIKAVEDGTIQAVLAWHTDRLYRTLKDLVRLLDVGKSLEIRTVQGGDIDLSTASGRMVATILGSVSNQESEHHAERRREANKARALAGQWYSTGMRCYGYDRKGVPLEPEATLLRNAARDILAGRSLSSIAREMNEGGHRTVNGAEWSNLHLRRALMTPRIAAQSVHQGEIVAPGKWEPIIDEVTWRGLCAFLRDPARKVSASFTTKYLGSGRYICGYRHEDADPADPDSICGRKLYAAYPHGKSRSMVYGCRPVAHLGRSGARLDELVETTALAYLLEHGVGAFVAKSQDPEIDVETLRTQRDAAQATKDELAGLLRRGILDVAGVEREAAILSRQIAELNAKMAETAQSSPATLLLADGEDPEILADDQLLMDRFIKAETDIKGKLVSALFDVVVYPAPRGKKFDPDLVEFRWH